MLTTHQTIGSLYCALIAPFDYPKQATLRIPTSSIEPTDKEFSDHIAKTLPEYLNTKKANLVLFASYWQMDHVSKFLRTKGFNLLVQGEMSREALLKLHTKNIDEGKGSILFGTQSLSEGLDLPGKYLENLIITKELGCLGCLRITVGTEDEVSRFLRELASVLETVRNDQSGQKLDKSEQKTEDKAEEQANDVVA